MTSWADEHDRLYVYTIYDNPADFRGAFVVRRHRILPGRSEPEPEVWGLAKDLAGARQAIPDGMVCITRSPDDDPVIVETWL